MITENPPQGIQEMIGKGFADRYLSDSEITGLVSQAFEKWDITNQRVLVVIPDTTRTAPIELFFRLFEQLISPKAKALDYIIALGTHPIMSEDAINQLLGISAQERREKYAHTHIYNHRWDLPETYLSVGHISAEESSQLSNGMLSMDMPVRINRIILDYDLLIVCGPVFPHEVVGFSGGSKYFFPGISGPELINFTHWLGALMTSYQIIGTKSTPVRAVIERAAQFIPRPKLYFCMVVQPEGLRGLYISDSQAAWDRAADLSSQVHIRYVPKTYQKVLSIIPRKYTDLWTGAKGMYKLEPVIADGGEVVIYGPHIGEFSYTHGQMIEQIGYHVRDYFVKQWGKYKAFPWGTIAHSTHLRGLGSFENGIEKARIKVTLATNISEARCTAVGLGYLRPDQIDLKEWTGREAEGVLVVPNAGEVLYRLK